MLLNFKRNYSKNIYIIFNENNNNKKKIKLEIVIVELCRIVMLKANIKSHLMDQDFKAKWIWIYTLTQLYIKKKTVKKQNWRLVVKFRRGQLDRKTRKLSLKKYISQLFYLIPVIARLQNHRNFVIRALHWHAKHIIAAFHVAHNIFQCNIYPSLHFYVVVQKKKIE